MAEPTADLQSLMTLLALHERRRDAAMVEHQRTVMAAAAANAQTEQLCQYRTDYEQRWGAQFRIEGRMELVHCYQGFTQRLSLAIEQQTQVARRADEQVGLALASLRENEMSCASVRKLIERRTHQRRLDAERHEQKQSDEHASRAAWNRLRATGPH